jgi:hypothetical protein
MCPYRKIRSIDEIEYSANCEGLDYEFSVDIIRKIGENGSG